MNNNFYILKDEIEEQLASIHQLEETLKNAKKDDYDKEIFKRVCASILEDFYMAAEKIFKSIANEIDKELPDGNSWHKKLLRQMSIEIPKERPAVITKALFHDLEEYLKFRHLTHNIYGFQLEYNRFEHLIDKLPKIIKELEKQIISFLSQMEKIIYDEH